MPSIEVDFDVFKALLLKRPAESISENDVLREMLGLPSKSVGKALKEVSGASDWITKGVHFPSGTEFRSTYKGAVHLGRVESGALVAQGVRHNSPSSAAMAITSSPVNGWVFWECRLPGTSGWQQMIKLRK